MAAPQTGTRRGDVELLRIVSAFAVVWFHVNELPGRDVAYAGLVVFLVFAAYFAAVSSKTHSLWSRIQRLMVPCLIWSLAYAGLRLARGQPIFMTDTNAFSRWFATPSIHLWFLPFIFFALVLIDRLKGRLPGRAMGIGAGVLTTAVIASSPWWRGVHLGVPWDQYVHAFTGVSFGVFLGCQKAMPMMLRSAGLLLVAGAVAYTFTHDIPRVSLPYAVGLGLSCVLLLPASLVPASRWLLKLSGATLGIYILHVGVLLGLYKWGVTGVAAAVVAFGISTVLVLLTQRVMPKRAMPYVF